jgi:hypothetical protein
MSRPTDKQTRIHRVVMAARSDTRFSHDIGDVVIALADDLAAAVALLRDVSEHMQRAPLWTIDGHIDHAWEARRREIQARLESSRLLAQHPRANEQPESEAGK